MLPELKNITKRTNVLQIIIAKDITNYTTDCRTWLLACITLTARTLRK